MGDPSFIPHNPYSLSLLPHRSAVLFLDPGNPDDAVVVAVWT
jgi:hypothetical protein